MNPVSVTPTGNYQQQEAIWLTDQKQPDRYATDASNTRLPMTHARNAANRTRCISIQPPESGAIGRFPPRRRCLNNPIRSSAGMATLRLLRKRDVRVDQLPAIRFGVVLCLDGAGEKRHVRASLKGVDDPLVAQADDLQGRHRPARRPA